MSIPNLSLKKKVALITGGRRGIGRAIALGFAEAGADVVICGWTDGGDGLQAVASDIRQLGQRCLTIQADVSRESDVDNLIQKVVNEFSFVDILVNNAAASVKMPLLELSEDEWDKDINVNLKGYYLCSKAVAPIMMERKRGNIINIASQMAFKSAPNYGAYCIAKAGVVMLTRQLARDLASYNIRVNAIAPASVKTEFTSINWHDAETLNQYEATVPLGYMADPSDMIGPALFLASDASRYVTGHTILVDGGINA